MRSLVVVALFSGLVACSGGSKTGCVCAGTFSPVPTQGQLVVK